MDFCKIFMPSVVGMEIIGLQKVFKLVSLRQETQVDISAILCAIVAATIANMEHNVSLRLQAEGNKFQNHP
jgi:hypothetical protein